MLQKNCKTKENIPSNLKHHKIWNNMENKCLVFFFMVDSNF